MDDVRSIVFYDGECGFCNRSVSFIWQHDSEGRFCFAALQSDLAQRILSEHGVREILLDTMYVYDEGALYSHSRAVMRIASGIGGWPMRLLASGMALPGLRHLADDLYRFVARHRMRLMSNGKEACAIPPPDVRARFLDA